MKIGIVADNYKVPAFEQALGGAGFTYKKAGPLVAGTTSIIVECEAKQLTELRTLVEGVQRSEVQKKQKEN